jgi:hypothetical protein
MQDGKTRFIRVKGRVVPIKAKDAKGPSAAQRKKNYSKYGDGANQASRIDQKYEKKAKKAGEKGGYAALAGGAGAFAAHKLGKGSKAGKLGVAAGLGLAVAGIISGHVAAKRSREKNAVSREKDYVKAFGTTSDGSKPSKTRKIAKNQTGF